MGNRGNLRADDAQYRQPPDLKLLCEARGILSEPLKIGQTSIGHRLEIAVEPGGRIEGPRIHGEFLAGSMLSYLVRPDGIAEVSGRQVLRMDDGPVVFAQSWGIRRMSEQAVTALSEGQPYDPAALYGRAFCRFEAAQDGPYAWLSQNVFLIRTYRTVDELRASYWEVL